MFPYAKKAVKSPELKTWLGISNWARGPEPQVENKYEVNARGQTDATEAGTHTISMPRFTKNQKGDWVYQLGKYNTMGVPFIDTRFNQRLQNGVRYTEPHIVLDESPAKNYYLRYMKGK